MCNTHEKHSTSIIFRTKLFFTYKTILIYDQTLYRYCIYICVGKVTECKENYLATKDFADC